MMQDRFHLNYLAERFRSRPWILLLCFLVLSVPFAIRVKHSFGHASTFATAPVYNRVDFWIASSKCTVQTGAILALCSAEGKPKAIEEANFADDRGHTLLANLYSLATDRIVSKATLAGGNILLNALAFYLLACMFYAIGWKVSAVLLLAIGSRMAVPGPIPSADASAAHVAAFCLAMIAVLWVAYVPLGKSKGSKGRFLAGLLFAAFCLAWATLLRQPYGLGGFLAGVLVFAVRLIAFARRREARAERISLAKCALIVAGFVLAAFFPTNALVKAREVVYGIPPGTRILQHGISHNLYLGLGVENNPWGIKWDDIAGHDAAERVGKADYASEEHYANLRRLYVEIVLSDPIAVTKIYAQKFWMALLISAGKSPQKLALAGASILLLLAILLRSRSGLKDGEAIILLATWAGFGTVLMQGVLALPVRDFISPGNLGAICGIFVLLEAAGRSVTARSRKKP